MSFGKVLRKPRTWILFFIFILALLLVAFHVVSNSFEMTPKEMNALFRNKPDSIRSRTYVALGHQMHYEETGSDTNQLVLFVHGAPGSWDAFAKYLADTSLMNHAHVVAVDRPGYGKSDFGKSVTSIDEQARMIAPILDSNRSNKPAILVGHSLGGPIIAQLAMNHPGRVAALIFLAPAIDPQNEKIWWISKPADLSVFKWMVPTVWRVTNDEKLAHVSELQKMIPLWQTIRCPCWYFYGKKDMIVPPINVEFAKRMIINAPLHITAWPDENHFIPWTQQDSITRVVLHFMNER